MRGAFYFEGDTSLNHTVNLWPLLGVAVIIAGFALRAHPVLVVVAACFVTGFAAAMDLSLIHISEPTRPY